MQIKSAKNTAYFKGFFLLIGLLALLISFFYCSKESTNNNSSTAYAPLPDSIQTYIKKPITLLELVAYFDESTIYLGVQDEASEKMSSATKDFLKSIGGKELSRLGFRQSYAGVIQDGVFVEEKRAKEQVVSLTYENQVLESAGAEVGNYFKLVFNRNEYEQYQRGLHCFVNPPNSSKLIHYIFDFYAEENPTSKGQISRISKANTEQIELVLDQKAWNKIQNKRKEALKTNLLLTGDDDLVKGTVIFDDQEYQVETRLKGDWVDHLEGKKWSFRVKVEGEETIMGMRKFSLHHPKTRNYAGEWLFHQLLAEQDILHLQYKFVQFWLTVPSETGPVRKNLGIYALEESFEKQLFERQQRRAGLILKLDESLMWEERALYTEKGIRGTDLIDIPFTDFSEFQIVPFGQKQILGDPNLKSQFLVAREMLQAYIRGERTADEVFDLEKLVDYQIICNLLGSYHAMVSHNWRLYYNPITARLEPIGFDANGLEKAYDLHFYPYAKDDLTFITAYNKKVEEIVESEAYRRLVDYPGLQTQLALLRSEYSAVTWSEKTLRHNFLMMKGMTLPRTSIHAYLERIEEDKMYLRVENFGRMWVELLNLQQEDNRVFGRPEQPIFIPPKETKLVVIPLEKDYKKLFVNKKKKKSNFDLARDFEKVRLIWRTPGTTKNRSTKIVPWQLENTAIKNSFFDRRSPKELPDFEFIQVDSVHKKITLKAGRWKIKKAVKIPAGYTVIVQAGAYFDFVASYSQLISYSPVRMIGTKENPIIFNSESGKGGGIFVLGSQDTSFVQHCIFDNLGNPNAYQWALSGAVNFFENPVKISQSVFKNNRTEDALNVIRTYFEMDKVAFSNTQSDAFDGDFVEGIIRNTTFNQPGNDGIDVSGSKIRVEKVIIKAAGDKGLSAGENSEMVVEDVIVQNSEVAIACKDLSKVIANQLVITNNALGFTAFQKKPEFGPCQIQATNVRLENNELDHLIEVNSSLELNGTVVPVSEGVKERMYGAEFGKASR